MGRWALVMAAVAGTAVALGGCERADDKLTTQITRSSHALSMSAGSGRAMASAEKRSETYSKVIADLTPALEGASQQNQAVAHLLIARAKAGQALVQADEFVEAVTNLTNEVTLARSIEARLRGQLTVAESLEGFDPRETLAVVETRTRELDAELAEAKSGLAELEGMQGQVQARIDGEDMAARAQREQEHALRDSALRADSQSRLRFIEDAVARKTAAEQHEKRAAEIRLELATVSRVVEDRRREVATLERLRRLQDETRARLDASQGGWGEQRRAAVAEAKESAEDLSAALARAKGLLDDSVTSEYEQAVSAYQSAVTQARSAQTSLRQQAATVAGSAQHALSDVHAAMAGALHAIADVVTNLQGLPDVAMTGLDAAALRKQGDEAKQAAAEAREAAVSSFRSAGGSLAEVADRMELAAGDAEEAPVEPVVEPDAPVESEMEWSAEGEATSDEGVVEGDAPAEEAVEDAPSDEVPSDSQPDEVPAQAPER